MRSNSILNSIESFIKKYKNILVIIFAPLIFLPLPIVINSEVNYQLLKIIIDECFAQVFFSYLGIIMWLRCSIDVDFLVDRSFANGHHCSFTSCLISSSWYYESK
jgi:hypothetical protein